MGKKNKSAIKLNKTGGTANSAKAKHVAPKLSSGGPASGAAPSSRCFKGAGRNEEFDRKLMELKERNMRRPGMAGGQKHQQVQKREAAPFMIAPPTFVFTEKSQFQQTDSALAALLPDEQKLVPTAEEEEKAAAAAARARQRTSRFAALDSDSDEDNKYVMKIAQPTFQLPSNSALVAVGDDDNDDDDDDDL